MEINLAQLDSSSIQTNPLRAEICIIGAGIAGLTLAHKLVQLGHDVLLLEAGGRAVEPEDATASSDVAMAGEPHPGTLEGRIRALGGTSLTWGGQLLPLPDENAWPVSSADLAPYNGEAERLLGVDDLPYASALFFAHRKQPAPALLEDLPQLEPVLSKFAPFSHRNLAHTLGSSLRAHSKARTLLHARATELLPAPQGDRIEAVLVRTPAGHIHRIEATHFVIASGTIEAARLLLASRSVTPQGVGNQHDQVGRNFHDHLTVTAATVHPPARELVLSALRPWSHRGTLHSLKLTASPALRSQLHLTPVMAHLTIDEPDISGVGALRRLLRARQQGHLSHALREALPQLPRTLRDLARLTWSAHAEHRRYVSPQAGVLLRLNAAQQIPSASRITLSSQHNSQHNSQRNSQRNSQHNSQLEALAQPKAVLDWRIHPGELATLRSFAAHLRAHLDRAAPSGIDWNPALSDSQFNAPIPTLDDARHAMGGCCMGDDARSSVVTPELRVHGLHNLFIASAATFPDGSPQLPTLPLMALTLRLASHLHAQR
jgi:choline dehydrogenase-like flavoprotein